MHAANPTIQATFHKQFAKNAARLQFPTKTLYSHYSDTVYHRSQLKKYAHCSSPDAKSLVEELYCIRAEEELDCSYAGLCSVGGGLNW